MSEVYKDGQCRCDLAITMATDITPYQLSMALQYIGIRFRQFSHALQQLARQSKQPSPNWFQKVEAEVVGGKYVYNITFNHHIACTGMNPHCVQFHWNHHASATHGKQHLVMCDSPGHQCRRIIFGVEGYQCIQGTAGRSPNLEHRYHAKPMVGEWPEPPRLVCHPVNCRNGWRS